jgi:hypothetical protein
MFDESRDQWLLVLFGKDPTSSPIGEIPGSFLSRNMQSSISGAVFFSSGFGRPDQRTGCGKTEVANRWRTCFPFTSLPSPAPRTRPRLAWETQEPVVICQVDQNWERGDVSSILHPNSSGHRKVCPLWRQLRSAAVSVQPRCVLVRSVIQLLGRLPLHLALVNILYFTGGLEKTQSVAEHIDKRGAASAGMRLPRWRELSLYTLPKKVPGSVYCV